MVIASSAAIIKDKRILLIKRSTQTTEFPNCWAFPGGRADNNETPKQCVVREVKEETGLEFEPKKLIKQGHYKDRKLFRFYGVWSGTVKTQEEEVSAYNWFSYNEAIKLELAFDYFEVIEILREKNLI